MWNIEKPRTHSRPFALYWQIANFFPEKMECDIENKPYYEILYHPRIENIDWKLEDKFQFRWLNVKGFDTVSNDTAFPISVTLFSTHLKWNLSNQKQVWNLFNTSTLAMRRLLNILE